MLLIFALLAISCAFATKDDLAVLKQDLQQTIKDESGKVTVRSQAEPASLADKISLLPRWTWFGLEFILVGGIFLTNARRLERAENFSRRERGALSFAVDVLNKIRDRHDDPPPDPDPPEEGPTLRVVK